MDDLISRQAAINAVEKALYKGTDPLTDTFIDGISDVLNSLPSAQTEPLTVNFAREMDRETVEKLKEGLKNAPVLIMAVNDSAEPERKKGRWIEDAESFYKAVNEKGGGVDENTPYFTDDIACSECLSKFSVIDNETERFDFCPNCGADMRGEEGAVN